MTGTRIRAAFTLGVKVTRSTPFILQQIQANNCGRYYFAAHSISINPSFTSGFSTHFLNNVRCFSSHKITKNLHLMTTEKEVPMVDQKSLTIERKGSADRPLVVFLEWMAAHKKHTSKFTDLYLNSGYDVLVAPLTPMQILFPKSGSQLVAEDLLKFLTEYPKYNKVLVHGFSVGGYVWGEICIKMADYPSIQQRYVGQVWDSLVDVNRAAKGVAAAVFPKSSVLRILVQSLIQLHLHVFYNVAAKYYYASSDVFHKPPVKAPALVYISRGDPICSYDENADVADEWRSQGMKVTLKGWDAGPHVGLLRLHRTEYIDELNKFLRSINLPEVDKEEKGTLTSKL